MYSYDPSMVCILVVLGASEDRWKDLSHSPLIVSSIIKIMRFMVGQPACGGNEVGEERPGYAMLVKRMMDMFMIKGIYGAMD
jgi:hypothetical protein